MTVDAESPRPRILVAIITDGGSQHGIHLEFCLPRFFEECVLGGEASRRRGRGLGEGDLQHCDEEKNGDSE
jgi:hypothetical protein